MAFGSSDLRAVLVSVPLSALLLAACGSGQDPLGIERRRAEQAREGTEPTAAAVDAGPSATPAPPEEPPPPPAPAAAPPDAAAPLVETFVSDLAYEVVANGYGPAEKDESNGELDANDGNALTIGGVTYTKGLGVHAASEVRVALNGQYKTFLSDVGVDDESGEAGTVVFQVIVDGVVEYDSQLVTGAMPARKVTVSVAGKQQLRLVVNDGGDGIGNDHGDWANARLAK